MKFKVTIHKPSVNGRSILSVGDIVIYNTEFYAILSMKLININYQKDSWLGDGRVFYYKR